ANCAASVASWAAEFPVRSNPRFTITLDGTPPEDFPDSDDIEEKWEEIIERIPKISTSSEEADKFFKRSAIVLRLLADINRCSITVGPSVQEEIWIPALVYQTMALDRLGFAEECVRPILDNIHTLVDTNGLATKTKQFDAQGAISLAISNHFYMTNDIQWMGEKFSALKRVADWVIRQRKRKEAENPSNPILKGLLAPGHPSFFDPLYWKTDYYYSHNFWSAGALEIASDLAKALGRHGEVERFDAELDKYKLNLDDSLTQVTDLFNFLPAGPFQRDNAGMIFNLQAFYPLKLYLPGFQPIKNTLFWLWDNYVHEGGVLIDQPWNAYGTYFSLLLAQAFRYTGEIEKIKDIIDFMIDNATNEAGWAEGISPLSKKGAVGDSPNGYVAAEWINLILDLFVEEFRNNPPILLKGMPIAWLKNGVSAQDILLHGGARINISANIKNQVLNVDWDYSGEIKENPHLALPVPLKEIPTDVTQISTFCVALPSQKGKVSLELKFDE
ncbi:MAG: hypothetical protein ACXAD7_14720, partial [Candidatus Kariarchaeaceae archaeon]